jgi:hypothetical protein
MTISASLIERASRRYVIAPNGCWLWTERVNRAGYGVVRPHGTTLQAHRVMYEAHVGPVPDGQQLDHLCHTLDASCAGGRQCPHRRCVNPAHLEPVTPTENVYRSNAPAAINARKTHCNRGHELVGDNLHVDSRGRRRCRECRRMQDNARWPRRKVARAAKRTQERAA